MSFFAAESGRHDFEPLGIKKRRERVWRSANSQRKFPSSMPSPIVVELFGHLAE